MEDGPLSWGLVVILGRSNAASSGGISALPDCSHLRSSLSNDEIVFASNCENFFAFGPPDLM